MNINLPDSDLGTDTVDFFFFFCQNKIEIDLRCPLQSWETFKLSL